MAQKFHKGDLVHIVADLGDSMRHFEADKDAIIVGSYKDRYGGSNVDSYTVCFQDTGQCSWYHTHQLELLEAGRVDLLKKWEDDLEASRKILSNLDWIFDHGQDVVKEPKGASVQALFSAIGGGSLWGRNGEGINYFENSAKTMFLAEPYLVAGDKAGWLALGSQIDGVN